MRPVNVGIVGSGFISGIYLENSKIFNSFEVVACADLIIERAVPPLLSLGLFRLFQV